MRICIIGDFSGISDEGFRNIASNAANSLSQRHEILRSNIRDWYSYSFWKSIHQFEPDIIHYFTAPVSSSFFIQKIIRLNSPKKTKIILSALHPFAYTLFQKPFYRFLITKLRPDLILTQSPTLAERYQEMGIKTGFLSNGVDLDRFSPATMKRKEKLREKYSIPKSKFILLHVGHIQFHRGVAQLGQIQPELPDSQILIIGSTFSESNKELLKDLERSGCLIWNRYFERIEELFQLSDCYIFPKGRTIFQPLSVLEAMACNLPVITHKFEGLELFFQEGNGLIYCAGNDPAEYIQQIQRVQQGPGGWKTREHVTPYSWERITNQLNSIYQSLLGDMP